MFLTTQQTKNWLNSSCSLKFHLQRLSNTNLSRFVCVHSSDGLDFLTEGRTVNNTRNVFFSLFFLLDLSNSWACRWELKVSCVGQIFLLQQVFICIFDWCSSWSSPLPPSLTNACSAPLHQLTHPCYTYLQFKVRFFERPRVFELQMKRLDEGLDCFLYQRTVDCGSGSASWNFCLSLLHFCSDDVL